MKNTIDEAIEVLQAFKAGNQNIETRFVSNAPWIKAQNVSVDMVLNFMIYHYVRIAPEPKRVPLEAKDIPPVCWIKDEMGNKRMITGLSELTFQTSGDVEHRFDHAVHSGWKYSTDLINWKPMSKEVVE